MTRTRFVMAAAAAAMLTAMPALANDAFLAEQKPTEYLAKDRLIGAKVHDSAGKIIGDIEDLIISNDQKVEGVIMGVGGFLGVGEKKVAVDVNALSMEATDGKMNVVLPNATKESLTAAPNYKRINPPKGWLQRAVEKGQELKDKGEVTAKDAYEKAKENAGPAIERAKEAAHDVIEKAREAAQPTPEAPAEAPKN